MYTKRYLEEKVLSINKSFKILYLGGPRQVGKTTLLKHLSKSLKMNYVTLDDLEIREIAQKDPKLFLENYRKPLFIDEIQYAPQLFSYLKIQVDNDDRAGQYWLTGSQHFALMRNVKESLTGRVGILYLLGFSFAEANKIPKIKDEFLIESIQKNPLHVKPIELFEHIIHGSFPASFKITPEERGTFFNSYIQTYLDRDLKDIFNVTKISTFHTFLRLCAARTGQILNYTNLARDCGISVNACREWINILEASMQIFLLQPYYKNFSKRLIKSPKLYFLDTGLATHLVKWKTPETLMNGAMAGAFFETFVVSEIIKSHLYRGQEPPIYYLRDKQGHEVDIVMEKNGKIYPIEIKMGININKEDIKNIEYYRKKLTAIDKGAVITLGKEKYTFDRNNMVIPVTAIN